MRSLRPDQRGIPGHTTSAARLRAGLAVVQVAHPAFGGRALDVALSNLSTSAGTSLTKRLRALAEALAREAFYARLRRPNGRR